MLRQFNGLKKRRRGEENLLPSARLVILSSTLLGRANSYDSLGRWYNDASTGIRITISATKTDNIRPSGTGESPLANIAEWVNVVDPETGKRSSRNEHYATVGRF